MERGARPVSSSWAFLLFTKSSTRGIVRSSESSEGFVLLMRQL